MIRPALLSALLLAACAEAPPPAPAAPAAAACPPPAYADLPAVPEGDRLADKGQLEEALARYEEAAARAPADHRIWFKIAMVHKKREDWAKVLSALARANQLAPKFAPYWLERGRVLEAEARRKASDWREAKEPLERCVQADPNLAECHEELGNVLLRLDDEQHALESYTRAVERDPKRIASYAPLADLYIRLGKTKEAEQVLRAAKAAAKPGDRALYGVHVLLAQVYVDRDAPNEAAVELEAARALTDPDKPEGIQILYSLGTTYARMARRPEAIANLKSFVARACRGASAKRYRTECESSVSLVSQLGGAE